MTPLGSVAVQGSAPARPAPAGLAPGMRARRLLEEAPPSPAGGLAVTSDGGLACSEPAADRILVIAPDGAASVVGGVPGFADGPGPIARFRHPAGIALAGDGSLVVADTGNHAIRLVDRQGNVTTLAGGANGLVDGRGAEARFRFPEGVATCGEAVLVADTVNDRVRRVDPDGTVATLAGSIYGAGALRAGALSFRRPAALASGPDGALYLADTGNNRVCRVDPSSGAAEVVAGGNPGGRADGVPGRAELRWPAALAVLADGTIYVTDAGGDFLRRITPGGSVGTRPGAHGWHPVALAALGPGVLLVAERRLGRAPAGRFRVLEDVHRPSLEAPLPDLRAGGKMRPTRYGLRVAG